MLPRALALILAAAAILAVAPAAGAKTRLSAEYRVTLKADMKEQWKYREFTSILCLPGTCDREEAGSGSAQVHLHTRRPWTVFVLRGANGRAPTINTGSDGIPLTGYALRQGTMTTTYSGEWDAANPDRAEPTTDCGKRTINQEAGVGWSYENPWTLQLITEGEPFRADCPDGPPQLDWSNDDSPLLSDVLASVGKGKFLGTKQFTVRGSRTWTGVVPPVTGNGGTQVRTGDKSVTWQWEATFRMKGAKRRRR